MLSIVLAALTGHVFSVGAVPLLPRQDSNASAFCTSSDLNYKLSSITGPVKAYNAPGSGQTGWDLSIDDSSAGHKQNITGFGAAITDATVVSMNSLNSTLLNDVLTNLMTSSGANFALMRHTIGSSDLSPAPAYTYDDAGGNVDTSLSSFNLGDSGNAMAKFIANLRSINSDLQVLGSPWSAPAWMKVNDALDESGVDNVLSDQYSTSDQPDYSEPFAQYFVKYLQAYEALGAHIDAITIQNEPLNNASGLPTMFVAGYEEGHLIQDHVAPALQNASLQTSIWAYDHNTDHATYPEHVLSVANASVDTVAWHCYASNVNWTVLTEFHDDNPGVSQYMTECYTPPIEVSATSTNWSQAADFTIGPLQNWAEGVIAWTLSTDSDAGPHLSGGCSNCFGLVTVNDASDYEFTMAYYLIAQFSKFMPKGSTVLDGSGSYEDVQSVASLNPDGTRSVVILNKKQEELYLRLNTTGGESWSGAIPSNSIVTWVLPSGS